MPKDTATAKLLARLMAVQALYSWEASGAAAPWTKEDITPDMAAFYREQAGNESGIEPFEKEDRKLFRAIASGALEHHAALDAAVAPHLERDAIARLPMTLKAILRAALYEIRHMALPVAVAIREYAKVTEMLVGPDEVSFVHAVLDKAGKEAA